jgi:endonuclease/exonuclease/phosphatase family metal-dependent hydrolase
MNSSIRSFIRLRTQCFFITLIALLATATSTAAQTDIVLDPQANAATAGRWVVGTDSTAVNGVVLKHPNAGAAKLTTPLAAPANYFELTFEAVQGTPYRLWLHGRAERNYWGNDSVFVQFDGAVTAGGTPAYRIGTTSATEVNLEECSGCGLTGWAWQDNGWGRNVLGPVLYFASTGTQRIRVQTREDGLSVDQIVLSPSTYLTSPPTAVLAPVLPVLPAPATEKLKVLHWNIHHGLGTDNVYNLTRFVDWIVASGANVVSLNEVERFVGSYGNQDQPAVFAAQLTARTGKPWYYKFAHRTGGTNGQGNLLLSQFPIEDSDAHLLSYSRSVARIRILVNNIPVNVFSTHLDADYSSRRLTQVNQMNAWAASFAEQRIEAGDFNAYSASSAEIKAMAVNHLDAWLMAKAKGTAVTFPDNPSGATRNTRIDYVWHSKAASRLVLLAMQVLDTRAANGVMPSDHRPILATYDVK